MNALKVIFFIVSCLGFYLCFIRIDKVKKEFIPIILISTIAVIEYLAGILNFMKYVTILIGVIGFFTCIHEIYIMIKNKKKLKIDFNSIIFLLFIALFAYLLKGRNFIHYDDFSHWGMIVKDMLKNDRLPNFTSNTIQFTAYPPGTACFVYYMCKYIGKSEGAMLFAQSILIFSSIYTIYALENKKNRIISTVICILSSIYLLLGNMFITALVVDTVLAVLAIAALVIIFYYRNDTKKGLILSIPLLSLLILVKNSGILFVLIDLIVWFIYYIKSNGKKKIFKSKYILMALIPFLMFILWEGHIRLVFSRAYTSRHAMSVDNYIQNFKAKDTEEIAKIFDAFIKRTVKPNKQNIPFIIILITFIILIAMSWKNKDLRKEILFLFKLGLISYFIYQIGLFAMFIFSMPLDEAIKLAGYERYLGTMTLYICGILIIGILEYISKYDKDKKILKYILNVISIVSIIFMIVFAENNISVLTKRQKKNNSVRFEILDIQKENHFKKDKKYLVYVYDDQNIKKDYVYYICKYEFWTKDVKVIRSLSEIENINDYDYIIVLRESEEIDEFVEKKNKEEKPNVIRSK